MSQVTISTMEPRRIRSLLLFLYRRVRIVDSSIHTEATTHGLSEKITAIERENNDTGTARSP